MRGLLKWFMVVKVGLDRLVEPDGRFVCCWGM